TECPSDFGFKNSGLKVQLRSDPPSSGTGRISGFSKFMVFSLSFNPSDLALPASGLSCIRPGRKICFLLFGSCYLVLIICLLVLCVQVRSDPPSSGTDRTSPNTPAGGFA